MIKHVAGSIRKQDLFKRGERVLVAVSGGADSVALLCALHELAPLLEISLAVAHLNHCIRGKDSDADAEFVRKLAKRLNISFTGKRINVPEMAKRTGLSMEMAAREARYSFFLETARRLKAGVIATAHTANDQAETVLLKLARGAGMRGLAGIPREIFHSGIRVVRPLLDVSRKEIERFLKDRKQIWRQDHTNLDPAYLRNRVRHEVLPFLEKKLNPDIRQALIRTADILLKEDEWLDELTGKILKECVMNSDRTLTVSHLLRQPVAARRRVLRQWLSLVGILPELIDYDVVVRVEALLDSKKGTGKTEIADKWIIKRRYDRLIAGRGRGGPARNFRYVVKIPGKTLLAGGQLKIETSLQCGMVKDKLVQVGQLPARASLDFSAAGKKKLIVRSWQMGDRMKPFGMNGSKKLQDIFIDAKVPVEQRATIPVFECGGEIVWIPGYRVASGWEVKDPLAPLLQIRVKQAVK